MILLTTCTLVAASVAGSFSESETVTDASVVASVLPEAGDDLGIQLLQAKSRLLKDTPVLPNKSAAGHNMLLQIVAASNSSHSRNSTLPPDNIQLQQAVALGGGVAFMMFALALVAWIQTTKTSASKSAFYSMLSPHSHRPQAVMFRSFIATVVIVNVAILLVQTSPGRGKQFANEFQLIEGVSSWIFFIEFCMRLYVIPESKRYLTNSNLGARLRWIITFESIIDILAFLPWFIEAFADMTAANAKVKLPSMTWLRVLRLFRLLKIKFVSESMDVFARVLYYNSEILIVSLILSCVLILLLSVLLYSMAPQGPQSRVGDYSSVMACMYLAVMMLTGQGQPEGVLPWYTKIVVVITCVFAVGLFAMQASMLTYGFEIEAARRVKKNKKHREDRVKAIFAGDNVEPISSSSSEDEVDSDWEEYEENIVGSDTETEDEEVNHKEGQLSHCGKESNMRHSFLPKQWDSLMKIVKYLDVSRDGQLSREKVEIIPDMNAEAFFKQYDQNDSNSISVTEFITWVKTVKEKQPPEIFKMFLKDLLKASKGGQDGKRKGNVDDKYEQQVNSIEIFAKGFRSLKSENAQLHSEIKRLKKEMRHLQAQQRQNPGHSSSSCS